MNIKKAKHNGNALRNKRASEMQALEAIIAGYVDGDKKAASKQLTRLKKSKLV